MKVNLHELIPKVDDLESQACCSSLRLVGLPLRLVGLPEEKEGDNVCSFLEKWIPEVLGEHVCEDLRYKISGIFTISITAHWGPTLNSIVDATLKGMCGEHVNTLPPVSSTSQTTGNQQHCASHQSGRTLNCAWTGLPFPQSRSW